MTSLAVIATSDAADGVPALARSDCAAVHLARLASEDAVAVCPAGDRAAIEYALAAGIRNVQDLEDSPPAEFDVAYVGTGCAELIGDIYLARWAEQSNASLLFDVIRCSEEHEEVRDVECDAGRGARYLVSVHGPMIMVLSPHVARPPYVSRYRRHATALQLSREGTTAHDEAVMRRHTHAWSTMRPRVRAPQGPNEPSAADDRLNGAFSIDAGDRSQTTSVIVADPETCARHLLRYLAHHCIVRRGTSDDWLEAPDVRQVSTASGTMGTNVQPNYAVMRGGFIDRRPRQADDSPARRARQPRPADEATLSISRESPGGFMERRPRQADESSARRARQPRPLERP